MRIIFNLFFYSPLEQFEISSYNTFLCYINTLPIDIKESVYNFNYNFCKFYTKFDIFFILSIVYILQKLILQKGFLFIYIFISILFTCINFYGFNDIMLYQINTFLDIKEKFSGFAPVIPDLYLKEKPEDMFNIDETIWLYESFKSFIFFAPFLNLAFSSDANFFIQTPESFIFLTQTYSFINIFSITFCFIFIYIIMYLFYNKSISNNSNFILPNIYQILMENIYKTSLNVFYSVLGRHVNQPEFFIKINTLFVFLIISNVQGMIPYMNTLTSALTNTFFIALALFISIIITLLDKKGLNYFLNLFMPSGCPIFLVLLLVPIELISYSFRVVSLSVRLFANMMAGHTLLKVIVGFSWVIIFLMEFSIINLFPILILFILTLLEFGVALIQAYIFTILSCIYLRDIFEGH